MTNLNDIQETVIADVLSTDPTRESLHRMETRLDRFLWLLREGGLSAEQLRQVLLQVPVQTLFYWLAAIQAVDLPDPTKQPSKQLPRDSDTLDALVRRCCDVLDWMLNRARLDLCAAAAVVAAGVDGETEFLVLHREPLQLGLAYPHAEVRHLALHQLTEAVRNQPRAAAFLVQESTLFPDAIMKSLTWREDIRAMDLWSQLMTQLCRSEVGQQAIVGGPMQAQFQSLFQHPGGSLYRLRGLDCLIRLMKSSPAQLMASLADTYGDFMSTLVMTEMGSEDLASKINCVEIMATMTSIPLGMAFLEKHKILDKLCNIVQHPDLENVEWILLGAQVLRFFGSLAVNQSSILESLDRSNGIIGHVTALAKTPHPEIADAAVTAMGSIGSTPVGLALLSAAFGPVSTLIKCYKDRRGDSRVPVVRALAAILAGSERPSDSSTQTCRRIIDGLGDSSTVMGEWISLSTNSFPDIRMAGMAILRGLCRHRWGVERMLATESVTRYLFDRSTEFSYDGKVNKFEVVQDVHRAVTVLYPDIRIPESTRTKLDTFVKQGPFYNRSDVSVAMSTQ